MRIEAFRVLITAAFGAVALAGCVHRSGPVASVGQTPAASPGAMAAVRDSFAASGSPPSAPYSRPRLAEAVAPGLDPDYRLDAGDKLRVVIYGQEGLTNTYVVGASGAITMPLIGAVPARGLTPSQLARTIAARLRDGYIRDPSVAAEIEAYRPFFILGEVAAPGQYPYVPNMTAESAVAIAGGYSPRARRDRLTVTRSTASGPVRTTVPPGAPIRPGDTIAVGERWF